MFLFLNKQISAFQPCEIMSEDSKLSDDRQVLNKNNLLGIFRCFQTLQLGFERFCTPEILFRPADAGFQQVMQCYNGLLDFALLIRLASLNA